MYPVAPDASPETALDWKTWIRDALRSAVRCGALFSGWRCFADYGEGNDGRFICAPAVRDSVRERDQCGPQRAYSTGSLTHFTDGRDFPDLLATMYDYPGATVNLHCNQNNQNVESTVFYGREATLTIVGNTITVAPQDISPQPEGYSLDGWTAEDKKKYLEEWRAQHPDRPEKLGEVETFSAPRGYDDTADHIANFFRAVETREHVIEDEVFGNHAAIACHMANHSYFHRNVATWDASAQTIKGS